MRYEARVTINATNVNPFLTSYGLLRNPFPAIAERRPDIDRLNRALADLEAGPIGSRERLLEVIDGCSDRFRQLCLAHYRPGATTSFRIWWAE